MVPSHIEHDDEGVSPIYDTLALLPSNQLLLEVGKKKGVETLPAGFFDKTQLLPRSDWLNRLVEEYFFERVVAKRLGSSDPVVARALRFIEGNLFTELTLKTLSQKSHSSESTLQRKFRELVGNTPMDYVRIRRLEEAANLLKRGSYSVADVASIVGYTNAGAFSEAFRLQYGQSPSAYQKKAEQ